jgi:hypothetical protein
MKTAILVLAVSACALAQEIKYPPILDSLAKKAKESVNVTLDKSTLSAAGSFFGSKDKDEAKARKAIEGLRGIYVRSYEFEKAGEYAMSELEPLREQFRAAPWKKIVSVLEKEEMVEIYVKDNAGKLEGLFVLAAEPKELTVVHLDGPVNLSELGSLGGQFGIPEIVSEAARQAKSGQAAAKKE